MKPDAVITEFAQKLKKELGKNLLEITLFGSRARGDHKEWSDYDCLVILKRESAQFTEIIDSIGVEILDKYDAFVVPIICTLEEWEREERLPLGKMIAREGVTLGFRYAKDAE